MLEDLDERVDVPVIFPRRSRSWTLLLDRDGVLNEKIQNGNVLSPSMLRVLPGAPEAVAALSRRFAHIVIVTNQRGIGRGLMGREDLEHIHAYLLDGIGREGGKVDEIFVGFHDLQDGCDCRKPKIGLVLQARAQMPRIDFARCVLAGDSDTDMKMGRALGMITVRVGAHAARAMDELAFADLLEFANFLDWAAEAGTDVG